MPSDKECGLEGKVPEPNQLQGQEPPAKKQMLSKAKSSQIDDDTALFELLDPAPSSSSSSTQRPAPELSSTAPELKEPRTKTKADPTTLSKRGSIRSRKATIPWETVKCDQCGQNAGQLKFDPCPGQRDKPTWYYRVHVEKGGALASQASCLYVLRCFFI